MSSLRRHIGVLGQIAGFYLIHFLFFGRHFVDGSAILVGDSQIDLAIYSLNAYREFLWWDPTGLDGYPALVNLTHGWFNYLSPLILPSHVFAWIAISFLHWPLVTAVQVQLFSLAYLSSLIFVVLLSRELIRSPLARLFPPLVFTLGASANQFFMLAQHGPALAPTLAYLFGLIYFWRRRTPSSLFVFMVFLSCFVASINYITFSSHLFPLVLFTSPRWVHSDFSVLCLERVAGSAGNQPRSRVGRIGNGVMHRSLREHRTYAALLCRRNRPRRR
jgi:hypothetical protein